MEDNSTGKEGEHQRINPQQSLSRTESRRQDGRENSLCKKKKTSDRTRLYCLHVSLNCITLSRQLRRHKNQMFKRWLQMCRGTQCKQRLNKVRAAHMSVLLKTTYFTARAPVSAVQVTQRHMHTNQVAYKQPSGRDDFTRERPPSEENKNKS